MTRAWNFLRMRTRRSGNNNPNIADARTYGNGGSSGSGGGGGGGDDQNIGIVNARQLLNYLVVLAAARVEVENRAGETGQ